MKKLGVEHIIAVSAVGSMKEEIKPLDIVIPDQFLTGHEAESAHSLRWNCWTCKFCRSGM